VLEPSRETLKARRLRDPSTMQRLSWPAVDHRGTLYVRPSRRIMGAEFGREELRHVLIGGAGLGLMFAISFARLATGSRLDLFPSAFVVSLPFAMVAAFLPFLLSLILQKRVAEREGCTTEFKVMPQWLGISLLFALLFGFVFAIPGATSRFGNVTRTSAARMSAAVPLAFIGVASAGLIGAVVGGASLGFYGYFLFAVIAQVNATMAAFAMLPVPGFPGGDILRASKPFFALLLGSAAFLWIAASAATRLFF
jgi:Zn-dependent protease